MLESHKSSVFTFVKSYAARMKSRPPVALHLLIVDDEEPVRKFVDRVLREAFAS